MTIVELPGCEITYFCLQYSVLRGCLRLLLIQLVRSHSSLPRLIVYLILNLNWQKILSSELVQFLILLSILHFLMSLQYLFKILGLQLSLSIYQALKFTKISFYYFHEFAFSFEMNCFLFKEKMAKMHLIGNFYQSLIHLQVLLFLVPQLSTFLVTSSAVISLIYSSSYLVSHVQSI